MRVLVVSYDKTLITKLEEVFRGYEFFHVRSGEEAARGSYEVQAIPEEVDLIVYDAVSGAFSEEDINTMYSSRFQNAKYIVLIDELFPVDMNNIAPQSKIGIPREKAISEIQNLISSGSLAGMIKKTAEKAPPPPSSFIEPPPAISEPIPQAGPAEFSDIQLESAIPGLDMPSFDSQPPQMLEEIFEIPSQAPSIPQQAPSILGSKAKLLIVAFERQLIENLKSALANHYDISVVSNMKESPSAARKADVVIFDTISGNLAERILTEMAGDPILSEKHFVLLLDDLFAIDADRIPLPKKQSYSREKDIQLAVSYLKDLAKELTPTFAEPSPIQQSAPEQIPAQPEPKQEKAFSLLEELVKEAATQGIPIEFPPEEISTVSETQEDLTESAPSAQTYTQEAPPPAPPAPAYIPEKPPVYTQQVPAAIPADFETLLAKIIEQELSEVKIARILSSNFRAENVSRQISENLRGIIREEIQALLEEEISKAFSKLDIATIIKEQAYKVLKESIKELLI
ncbi:MAG: hypothetical protein ABDH18_01920 [Aquificaceae bacterium]